MKKSNISYWDKELLPKIKSIYDNISNNLISEDLINSFNKEQEALHNSKKSYKKNHNQFLYFLVCVGLFFSALLLCIPLYWNIKKYKELKKNKQNLLADIEQAKYNKLAIHNKLLSELNYNAIADNFKDLIPYRHYGPIPWKLIELMQESSLFNLAQDGSINSYDSSWGVFDNKIIINAANQIHERYIERYQGSKTVYVPYKRSDGTTGYASETVYAHYDYPAFRIENKKRSFCFMESCSNLEFYLDGTSNKFSSKKFNKKNNYSPLENEKFDKAFNWARSDDVQFRMVFSPYCQEMFLNEYCAKDRVTDELKWRKINSFISNEISYSSTSLLPEDWIIDGIKEFATNPDSTINDLKNQIFKSITNYYHHIYKSLIFMYLTTILSSEDHSNIIKYALNSDQIINGYNISYLNHYILNEAIKQKIILRDTDCFNLITNIEQQNINNHDLFLTTIDGLSYDKKERHISIPTSSSIGVVNVDVKYYEYIAQNKKGIVGSMYLNNNSYFYQANNYGIRTNINEENLKQEIINLNTLAKCNLKNNILSFYVDEGNNNLLQEIINAISRIISIVDNSNLNSKI